MPPAASGTRGPLPPVAKTAGAQYPSPRKAAGGDVIASLQELLQWEVAGLPLGFWIVVVVGLLAAIGLGIGVARRRQEPAPTQLRGSIGHAPSASASMATRRVRSKWSGVSVTSPAASAVTSDSVSDGGGGGSLVDQ